MYLSKSGPHIPIRLLYTHNIQITEVYLASFRSSPLLSQTDGQTGTVLVTLVTNDHSLAKKMSDLAHFVK